MPHSGCEIWSKGQTSRRVVVAVDLFSKRINGRVSSSQPFQHALSPPLPSPSHPPQSHCRSLHISSICCQLVILTYNYSITHLSIEITSDLAIETRDWTRPTLNQLLVASFHPNIHHHALSTNPATTRRLLLTPASTYTTRSDRPPFYY